MPKPQVRICFVCLGNICRSPTAEGVMKKVLDDAGLTGRVFVDSAGTGDYHVGELADPRSRAEAARRGVDLTSRARQFKPDDFDRFDYVIAMDSKNGRDLRELARTPTDRAKITLLRGYAEPGDSPDVPDPYYGGDRGFADVYDICFAGCLALLAHVRSQHGL